MMMAQLDQLSLCRYIHCQHSGVVMSSNMIKVNVK